MSPRGGGRIEPLSPSPRMSPRGRGRIGFRISMKGLPSHYQKNVRNNFVYIYICKLIHDFPYFSDSTVSLDFGGVPKNWGKLLISKKTGKGCHICGMAMARTDRKKKCHCSKMVHRECYNGDGDSCSAK